MSRAADQASARCAFDDRARRSLFAAICQSRRKLHHRSRRARSETRCRENLAGNSRCRLPRWTVLNPATPFEAVEPFLDKIDILLVMTVHPGFGGQPFRPEMTAKVKRAREWQKSHEAPLDITVDGGINPETARVDPKRRQRPRRRHLHLSRKRLPKRSANCAVVGTIVDNISFGPMVVSRLAAADRTSA